VNLVPVSLRDPTAIAALLTASLETFSSAQITQTRDKDAGDPNLKEPLTVDMTTDREGRKTTIQLL
jgi:hypothetical protein